MMKKTLLSIFFICITTLTLYAQGCSDAGFCTIDSFKPHEHEQVTEDYNSFKIGTNYGAADYSISAIGLYLEYNRKFSEKLSLDAKLTALSQSGNDISVFGLSDLFLNGNFRISDKATTTLGFKIPLMDGSREENGLPLPMDYQSSLGTFDLILGFGYRINRLQLVAAWQQPLTQNNNEFLAEDYPLGSPLRDFQSTNEFVRSGDMLLRASYPLNLGSKLVFTPSLLPIYHLANDKFTDADGIEREIEGSQGLTLNWNAYFDYPINDRQNLQLSLGAPFIVRDARPDGLTRSFVANLEYKISF